MVFICSYKFSSMIFEMMVFPFVYHILELIRYELQEALVTIVGNSNKHLKVDMEDKLMFPCTS